MKLLEAEALRAQGKRSILGSWWLYIALVDIVLVIITILCAYIPHEGFAYKVLKQFNLATELNFAVWWSSGILLLAALLAYELFSTRRDSTRLAWLIIAGLLGALAWDETGSFHERLSDFGWEAYVPFALVAGAGLFYAFFQLGRKADTRRSAILLAAGFGMFVVVAGMEYLQGGTDWAAYAAGLGFTTGLEEGVELFGVLLCLFGLVGARKLKPTEHPLLSILQPIVPRFNDLCYMHTVLLLGLAAHCLVSLLSDVLTDVGRRGDAAVWYPTALFLILVLYALWRFTQTNITRRVNWLAAAAIFGVFSVAMTYLLPRVLHGSAFL